jgi:hypothetical protein
MSHRAVAALQGILRPHVGLSKSRLETLCLIMVGMLNARTVNLTHLASQGPSGTLIASTYRRLQRFFQHVRLDPDWAVPLLAAMIGSDRWTLALDRTNWKIGRSEVNFLMLAAVTRRLRVPLFWVPLPHGGNSATADRIGLIRRYLAHLPSSSIRILLADREFIGADWLKFLSDNNIPFAIRIRENLVSPEANLRFDVTDEAGHELTLYARLRLARRTRTFTARLGTRDEADRSGAPLFTFAAKRLKGEWLIVVSNQPARTALDAYRKRWAIECLFGDAKTRGLNLEDTRLTCPRKLDLLMAIVALVLAWAGRAASTLLGNRAPARKAHGYLARSWFRTGFDHLRHLLSADQTANAVDPWQRLPKRLKIRGVV